MRSLRWFVMAFVVGGVFLLVGPGEAKAAIHHGASSTAAIASARALGSPPPNHAGRSNQHARRIPFHPAARSKTHRFASRGSRTGWPSLAMAPAAAEGSRPTLKPSFIRQRINDFRSTELGRTLESRGPPRAGPSRHPALHGPLPPSPSLLSSSDLFSASSPIRLTPRLTDFRSLVVPLPVARHEGRAAGIHTPSSGGSTS